VIERISEVAKAKKHIQNGKYSVNQTGDGNRSIIINNLNVALPISKEALDLLQDGTIDPDLDKLTAPLRDEAIDGFEIAMMVRTCPNLALAHPTGHTLQNLAAPKQRRKSVVMIGTLTSIQQENELWLFCDRIGKKNTL